MKKSDIAMVILIAALSVMSAFFVANAIPALKASSTGEKIKTVKSISASVDNPDTSIFNNSRINPTVETVIGSGSASASQ